MSEDVRKALELLLGECSDLAAKLAHTSIKGADRPLSSLVAVMLAKRMLLLYIRSECCTEEETVQIEKTAEWIVDMVKMLQVPRGLSLSPGGSA